ncbi:MAG: PGF-pre-PGF domain-containing protein [Nanoarchaeota archaeon]
MNFKNVLTGILLLSLIILSSPIMSAELSFNDFNEFFQDNVTQLTITINQNESQANLYLNTAGTSFDTQGISCSNLNITSLCDSLGAINGELNFNVSDLLNGVNGSVKIKNGFNYPQFESLAFSNELIRISPSVSVSFTFLINRIFSYAGVPLNSSSSLSEFNNYLVQNPLSKASDRNINFTKEGNYYTLWNDQGYGDIDNYKNEIRRIINESVTQITIPNLLSEIIPIINETSAGSGDMINNLLEGVNLDYTIGAIDLSSVQLKDGTYDIPVFIQKDNTTFTKTITLIIQGVENKETNIVVNGTYTPINPEIAYYIRGIDGLGENTLSVSFFDVFSSTLPSNTKSVIKYMDISVSNSSPGTIRFKVPVADVSTPSLVSLYVLESTGWVKLSTILINQANGFYEFESSTPHFSMFMITETIQTTSGGGGRSRDRTVSEPDTLPQITSPVPTTPEPIEATPPAPTKGFFAGITGAFIGALGTGGSIMVIVFIVSVVGLMVILRIKRKVEGKKGRKLNEEGDKNEV